MSGSTFGSEEGLRHEASASLSLHGGNLTPTDLLIINLIVSPLYPRGTTVSLETKL